MLQVEAPEHARGRVFPAMDVLWQGGRLLPLGVGGVLADRYGITVVYYPGGALLLAAAAAGFSATRGSAPEPRAAHTGAAPLLSGTGRGSGGTLRAGRAAGG